VYVSVTYVYIAGSSQEMGRVAQIAGLISEHNVDNQHAQIIITIRWWDTIAARGDANPVDAPFHERAMYAADDLDGVQVADVVWLLMPTPGKTSVGCYWEAGYADALRKEILISGDMLERSIFTTRGACFSTDLAALDYLFDIAFNAFDTE
jgi:hypothetical protein